MVSDKIRRMEIVKMKELKSYIYMDMVGVDSLLSQITLELTEKNHIQITKKKMGSIKGGVGLSDLFKGIFKADVSVSGEQESVQVIDKTTTQPYEAKIQQIVEYVENHEILLKDRAQIIKDYQEGKQNFVFANILFDTDFNYRNWQEASMVAEKLGYISFYKGGKNNASTYQYNDDYYKTIELDKSQILMNMSTEKMESFGGVTSHLATLFRVSAGINIGLGVFGYVSKIAPNVYQIKPYAVWRA